MPPLPRDLLRIDECRRLLERFGELIAGIEEAGEAHEAAKVARLLEKLIALVGSQFRREEEDGYLREVVKAAPRLQAEARELESQHPRLLGTFTTLLRSVRETSTAEELRRLAPELEAARRDLEEHEHRERAFIQEAFETDVGVAG